MLRKLERNGCSKVMPIFQELKNQVVIGSVIEGNTCGDVYVDDLKDPTVAVLWNKMDAILIEGVLDDDHIRSFADLVSTVFVPDAKSRDLPFFNIYYPNETWAAAVESQIRGLSPTKELKCYYEFDKLNKDWRGIIQADCILRQIDRDLLEQTGIENLDRVIGWIRSFWPSTSEFADKGVGYCLLQNGIVASWCLSVFVSGQKYELGLETIKGCRGKGYAKAVSSACVEYCVEHVFTPIWNCDAKNEASSHVAEAIGFRKIKEYHVWHLNLSKTP